MSFQIRKEAVYLLLTLTEHLRLHCDVSLLSSTVLHISAREAILKLQFARLQAKVRQYSQAILLKTHYSKAI